MKLSLLEKAVNTFLDGYWPKEVVEDWRYKKLFAASEAALAQQAQPLTDDFKRDLESLEAAADALVDGSWDWGTKAWTELGCEIRSLVRFVRDRVAQQAQPGCEPIDSGMFCRTHNRMIDECVAPPQPEDALADHSLVDDYPELAAVSRRRAEAAALRVVSQPLTDEMIEAEAQRCHEGDRARAEVFVDAAEWARGFAVSQPSREQIEALPRYVHTQTQISGNVNVVELSAVLALYGKSEAEP